MSELRLKGQQNLSDIAFAILEPNGQISVIPSNQSRPIRPSDMCIKTGALKLSFPIIIDGKLREQNLRFSSKDKDWLLKQFQIIGVKSIEDVLFAQIDSNGSLYVDLKDKNEKIPSSI